MLELRVMSCNMWLGGTAAGMPVERTADVIRAAGADIVGLQEASMFPAGQYPDHGALVAQQLGWHYLAQSSNCGIASRFPIEEVSPRGEGVLLRLSESHCAWVFNTHLPHSPYQPYQLVGIPYEDAPFLSTATAAIDSARAARGSEAAALLAEIDAVAMIGVPTFVTGDFNEPSHLDWTSAAAASGRCPLPVEWPTTALFQAAGFDDSYRLCFPDPTTTPGCTWSSRTSGRDASDRHDRIDFVLVRGSGLGVLRSEVVGEHPDTSDIVVAPFPSDHRAVVSTFHLP